MTRRRLTARNVSQGTVLAERLEEGASQRLLALALVRLPSAFTAHSAVNLTLESDDNRSLDSFHSDFGIITYLE